MKLIGPERFRLDCSATKFKVCTSAPDGKLARHLGTRRPKLYAVARRGSVVYVGITNQPIRARLRLGWSANGASGYYGYAFRHHLKRVDMFVWLHQRRGKAAIRELETIEAEVAYLVRRRKQWPVFQTEIHFYPSTAAHRRAAKEIVATVGRAR